MRNVTLFSRALLLVVALFGFQFMSSAQTTTAWTTAGTGTNVTGVGNDDWSNPGNITADDGNEARADINDEDESRYLRGTNFGFSIPAGATILGIEVRIERDAETANRLRDLEVYLMKGGSIVGDNKAVTTGSYGTSNVDVDYGGASDLWGTTWTESDINASNFGVSFRCWKYSTQNGARWVDVDKIQVRVTYNTLPVPVVNITSPSQNPLTIPIGTTVTLSGTASATGQTITSGEWDPGDGSTPYAFTGAGPFTTTHTYTTAGTYTATLSGTYNPTGTASTQIIVYDPNVATVTETFITGGSFTVPPGVTSIDVEAWGAGAGSGNGGGTEQGGGGGAYVGHTLSVTPGQTYTIVVPGQSATETAGGDASVTLVGASTPVILAKGAAAVPGGSGIGVGGQAADCIPAASAQSGGDGGAEGSDNNHSGGGGSSGHSGGPGLDGEDSNVPGAGVRAAGGLGHDGTATGRGAGGAGGTETSGLEDGLNGIAPGGGGGASTDGGSNAVGLGARGEVIITYVTDAIDLSAAVSVSNSTPETGDVITFEITATNNSTALAASNVQVTALLPSGYTFDAINQIGQGTYSSATGVWAVGSLAANSSTALKIDAVVNCSGDYALSAWIEDLGTSVDQFESNNSATIGTVPTYGPVACLVAVDDFSNAINSSGLPSPAIADILANDLINGSAVAPSAVTINVLSAFPAGVTYNASTREVTVTPGTPPGDYQMTYEICEVGNSSNCHSATVHVYISDLVDDYINQPVPLCQDVPDPTSAFGIELDFETVGTDLIALYSSPLMADIDNDGVVEIIGLSNNGQSTSQSGGNRYAEDIHIFNGQTGALELTIQTPSISYDGGTSIAVGDVDGDGFGEIIVATHHSVSGGDDLYLFCYEHTGTQKWKSDVQYGANTTTANGSSYGTASAVTVGLADFNQDGVPEVYVYNEIFNAATGVKLVDGGSNGIGDPTFDYSGVDQAISAAGDLTSAAGLELAAGRTVYEVSITNTSGTSGNTMTAINIAASEFGGNLGAGELDGFTALADMDLDGELDVIVAAYDPDNNESVIYVWNPRAASGSRLMDEFNIGTGNTTSSSQRHGALFVGDVDGDGDPDIGVCQRYEVEMIENNVNTGTFSLSRKWTLSTDDDSGRTGITMFDFNQDGIEEMVYRDESTLRIFNAGSGTPLVLASIPVTSSTGMEGPIVGDVDGDGSAEIVVANQTGTQEGQFQVYRSSLAPWAPARGIWNQYAYYITHISDNLGVPQYQSNHGQQLFFDNQFCPDQFAERPLNKFSVQSTYFTVNGCPSFPVFDAAIEIESATLACPNTDLSLTFTIHNEADIIAIPAGTPISFYQGSPLGNAGTYISTYTLTSAINAGASSGSISITIPGISPNTKIFAVANDDGSQAPPIELPTTGEFECDYSNNIAFFTTRCELVNPDVNATFVDVPVPGDVAENDNVTTGTLYGNPVGTASPGGSSPSITLNTDGTYTFTGDVIGVYTYDVEVCLPGQVSGTDCEITELQITVTDPMVTTNSPTANTDIATTPESTPVVVNTLANDLASSPGATLNPASVTVSTVPPASSGTTSVNTTTGEITFTPAAGFTGTVVYEYTVCETVATTNCATATQEITVVGAGFDAVSAADDYNKTVQGQEINVSPADGLLSNDNSTDPGATLQVSTGSVGSFTIAGKGVLSIGSNGGYVFTPAVGFTGPVSYPYEVCDANACASATLYIVVEPFETNPDINSTFVGVQVDGDVSTNDEVLAGTTYGNPAANGSNPSTDLPTVASDGSYTFTPSATGVYNFDVPVCQEGQTPVSTCETELLTITVTTEGITTGVPPVANTDIATTERNTPVVISTLSNDLVKTAGASLDPSSVSIVSGTAPSPSTEGSLSIDGSGNITFTPVPAFVGTVTYQYEVCDDQSPALCATATQEVTVLDNDVPNAISASDDYVETAQDDNVSGNVLTNDIDPEGDNLTVTAATVTDPTVGSVTFATDGSYTFTPATGYTGPGEFVYTVCDDGTPQACTEATLHVLVNSEAFTVAGTVWYDIDGLTNDEFDGTAQGSADPTNAGTAPLYINYIDDNGDVVATKAVETDGTFSIDVPAITGATLQLSTVQGTIGQPKPATSLPAGWGYTAEGEGTGPAPPAVGDGTPDGEYTVSLTGNISDLNFGFQQLPVTDETETASTVANPGGTTMQSIDASLFSGTDDGSVEKIRITEFPTNARSFAVGDVIYFSSPDSVTAYCPVAGFTSCVDFSSLPEGYVEFAADGNAAGDPVPTIQIDPFDNGQGVDPPSSGSNDVTSIFTYSTVDNAGAQDDGTGVVILPFSGDRDISVSAVSTCIDDVPYMVFTVNANFDITTFNAVIDWTGGTPNASLPQISPVVPTVQQTEELSGATFNGSLWEIEFYKVWPGASVDSSQSPAVATDWPGWVDDNTLGWIAAEDGYSGYRESNTSVIVSINPSDTLDNGLISYPPSTPFCASEPRALFSGTVWQDVDGSGENDWTNIPTNSESGTDATGLYAYVVGINPETGLVTVLDKDTVNADGTFSFNDCIQADDHTIVLSTDPSYVQGDDGMNYGLGVPTTQLPTGWVETSPVPRTGISTLGGDLAGVNLGIQQVPTSGVPTANGTVTNNRLDNPVFNPGVVGTTDIPAAAFGGTDNDPSGGEISALLITGFSSNMLSFTVSGGPLDTTFYLSSGDIPGTCPTDHCVVLPASGVRVPTNAAGEPTRTISFTPVDNFIDGDLTLDYKVIDNAKAGSTNTGAESDNTTTLEIPVIALKFDLTNGGSGWQNGSDASGKPDDTDGDKTLFWISTPVAQSDVLDIPAVVDNLVVFPGIDAAVSSCLTVNTGVKVDGTVRFIAIDDGFGGSTPEYGQYLGPALPNASFEMILSEEGWHNMGIPVSKANGDPLTGADFATENNSVDNPGLVNLSNDPATHNLWRYDTELASGLEQGFFINRSDNTISGGLTIGGDGYSSHAYGTWKMVQGSDDLELHGLNYFVDGNNASSLPVTVSMSGTTNDEAVTYSTHDNWGGWNMIPNPFPVSLDVFAMTGLVPGAPDFFGTEFDRAVWIWNPGDANISPLSGQFNKGAYVAVDAQTGAAVAYPLNASGNADVPDLLIAPMQSFYIRRTTGSKDRRKTHGGAPDIDPYAPNDAVGPTQTSPGADGSYNTWDDQRAGISADWGSHAVTIDPAHRSSCNITTHYKTNWDVMMLVAIDETNENLGDAAELVFDYNFTDGYDLGFDIQQLGVQAGAPVLFTIVEGEQMVINKMSYPEEVTTVPVGFYSEENNKSFRFELPEYPFGWQVYLEDKLTGAWHDMRSGAYSFKNNVNFRIDRFVLHFSMKSAPINPATPEAIAWGMSQGIEIHFEDMRSTHAEVMITNLLGQVLHNNPHVSTGENYIFPISDNDPKVYMVTVRTDELTKTIKVIR